MYNLKLNLYTENDSNNNKAKEGWVVEQKLRWKGFTQSTGNSKMIMWKLESFDQTALPTEIDQNTSLYSPSLIQNFK